MTREEAKKILWGVVKRYEVMAWYDFHHPRQLTELEKGK